MKNCLILSYSHYFVESIFHMWLLSMMLHRTKSLCQIHGFPIFGLYNIFKSRKNHCLISTGFTATTQNYHENHSWVIIFWRFVKWSIQRWPNPSTQFDNIWFRVYSNFNNIVSGVSPEPTWMQSMLVAFPLQYSLYWSKLFSNSPIEYVKVSQSWMISFENSISRIGWFVKTEISAAVHSVLFVT